MKIIYLMPFLMIALSFIAAIIYALNDDYNKAIYWLLAGLITITVTFKPL